MSEWWSADPVVSAGGSSMLPAHRDLAIRTIYGEAANEPDQGQAAVAAVIKNRMEAGRYGGKDIPGVVLAKNQFEPWGNNDARARMMALKPEDPRYQKIGGIVDQMFSGQMEDPTGGATHFVAPQAQAALGRQMPSWAQGDGQAIGRHTFFAPEGRVQQASAQGGNWWSNDPVVAGDSQAVTAPPSTATLPDTGGRFADTAGGNFRTAREGASPPVASFAQTFGSHAIKGASFNFIDELAGTLAAGGFDSKDPVSLNNATALARGLYKRVTGDSEADAAYRVTTSAVREALDRQREQQPAAAITGELGGALLTAPLGGATAKGLSLAERGLQGAKAGAIYGGLSGAGEGTDPQSRATGALTGAAVGAPIGGVAGAVIPSALSALSTTTSKPAIPAIQALKDAAEVAYQSPEIKNLVIQGTAVRNLSQTIQASLNKIGIDENLAPKTFGILSKLEKAPPGAQATGDNLNSVRRIFGNAANSADATERKAAKEAIDALDNFVPNVKPADIVSGDPAAAAAKWAEARGNYASAMRSENIDKKAVQAELRAAASNSGQNVANTVRQRMADILLKPAERRGYTASELQQMEAIVRGGAIDNTLRTAGNVLGGGGGMGAVVTGTAGALATGGWGVIAPAIGYALKAIGNRTTLNQTEKLSEAVRARSPLAASMASFGTKAQSFHQLQNPASFAAVSLAARNLSNNLKDAGFVFSPTDLMRSLAGPVAGRADQDQQQ